MRPVPTAVSQACQQNDKCLEDEAIEITVILIRPVTHKHYDTHPGKMHFSHAA